VKTLLAAGFSPIDLKGLNKKASMLKRTDQKYLLQEHELASLIETLQSRFFILEHEGRRVFQYESAYFDDKYQSYLQHHQGRRRRLKIRTRLYADCELCYLEVKTKGVRGRTIKHRMQYPAEERRTLNTKALVFINDICVKYGVAPPERLAEKVIVRFDRITLVAKRGRERVTIDANVRFRHDNKGYDAPEGLLIVETKTRSGNGVADKLLRRHHIRPQAGCSKYCIGVARLGLVKKKNNFLPVLKKIHQSGRQSAST